MFNEFNKNFFIKLSEFIDEVDYSSYTLQYPPPFILDNNINDKAYKTSFLNIKENIGIYIHIPFCDTKCTFCRYFSIIDNNRNNKTMYIEYLLKELYIYKTLLLSNNIKVNSLYIGGGTPSSLSKGQLNKLLKFVFSNFSMTNDFQFCFEANPNSMDASKIKILKAYNCDRLTLGVQSMDTDILKSINRRQLKSDVFRSIYLSKKYGIPYVNIDLMLGIKGQTFNSFVKDLKEMIYLKPDMIHLHPYETTTRVLDNNIFDSDDLLKKKMTAIGNKLLLDNGYNDIEGDAKGFNKGSRNKQLYDAIGLGKYLGIGISAVGFNGYYRSINEDTLDKYYESLDLGILPIKFGSKLNTRDNMIQYIIYNMRYGFLDLVAFYDKFKVDFMNEFKEVINILKNEKIIEVFSTNIQFSFQSPKEYSIYSKYFYDKTILYKYKTILNEKE